MASNTPAIKTEPTHVTPVTGIWDATFPLFHRLSREIDTMFERFGMERPVFEQTASGCPFNNPLLVAPLPPELEPRAPRWGRVPELGRTQHSPAT